MRFSPRLFTVVALTLLVTAVTSSAAVAAPQSAQDKFKFKLTITKANSGKVVDSATLKCRPIRGNHPDSAAACKDLAKVNGRIQKIPATSGVCPAIYDPVIAQATGRWHGQDRSYRHKFSNRCVANQETGGHVFNL